MATVRSSILPPSPYSLQSPYSPSQAAGVLPGCHTTPVSNSKLSLLLLPFRAARRRSCGQSQSSSPSLTSVNPWRNVAEAVICFKRTDSLPLSPSSSFFTSLVAETVWFGSNISYSC
ncbi:hypothetical protein SESBI_22590 [Sesbania bispinosa]|nr:hypothetical protein SESBI_22590 [Sesbania bispinosa]